MITAGKGAVSRPITSTTPNALRRSRAEHVQADREPDCHREQEAANLPRRNEQTGFTGEEQPARIERVPVDVGTLPHGRGNDAERVEPSTSRAGLTLEQAVRLDDIRIAIGLRELPERNRHDRHDERGDGQCRVPPLAPCREHEARDAEIERHHQH